MITEMLDKIADSLEAKGAIKEAAEIDVISNTIEASLRATDFFRELPDNELLSQELQHGSPQQAAFYRNYPRRALLQEMKRRGLKPLPRMPFPRPTGYTPEEGGVLLRPGDKTGPMKHWGLGGTL